MKVSIYNTKGNKTRRKATLDPAVFEIEPSDHAIWLDVRSAQANQRQGTHKAKERSEVRGGGAKLWRQKGTGRARVGTSRSPLWVGGGKIFGPRPRSYEVGVNRKTKRLARRSVLSYRLREDAIRVVEDFTWDEPKTSNVAEIVDAFEAADTNVLVLTAAHDPIVYKSGRNIKRVSVKEAASVSTLDLMKAGLILVQEGALEPITKVLGGAAAPEAPETSETETEEAEA